MPSEAAGPVADTEMPTVMSAHAGRQAPSATARAASLGMRMLRVMRFMLVSSGVMCCLLYLLRFRCLGAPLHRQRQPRHAHQAIFIVGDADFPDLGRAPEVQRPRDAGDPAARSRAQMIGVDVQADAV